MSFPEFSQWLSRDEFTEYFPRIQGEKNLDSRLLLPYHASSPPSELTSTHMAQVMELNRYGIAAITGMELTSTRTVRWNRYSNVTASLIAWAMEALWHHHHHWPATGSVLTRYERWIRYDNNTAPRWHKQEASKKKWRWPCRLMKTWHTYNNNTVNLFAKKLIQNLHFYSRYGIFYV